MGSSLKHHAVQSDEASPQPESTESILGADSRQLNVLPRLK